MSQPKTPSADLDDWRARVEELESQRDRHFDRAEKAEAERDEARALVLAMKEIIDESNDLMRALGQALMSEFPGEENAIAQLQKGDSLIERSIIRRLTTIKRFKDNTVVSSWEQAKAQRADALLLKVAERAWTHGFTGHACALPVPAKFRQIIEELKKESES